MREEPGFSQGEEVERILGEDVEDVGKWYSNGAESADRVRSSWPDKY